LLVTFESERVGTDFPAPEGVPEALLEISGISLGPEAL
jgi:hypothetical protein